MREARIITTNRARELRQNENDAEAILWSELRGRRLNGYKFVRQMPLGAYFTDFACRDRKLVVEIDGSQHADSDHDKRRDAFMVKHGWSVVRFWNGDIFNDLTGVLETILAICEGRLHGSVNASGLRLFPANHIAI